VVAELDAHRGRGGCQRGRVDDERLPGGPQLSAQCAEAAHDELGRRPRSRGLVVSGLVEVEHRVQRRVERGHRRVGEQHGLLQAPDAADLEEERGTHAVSGDQLLDRGQQHRAVGGGQRVREAARLGERDVVLAIQCVHDQAHEGGVQQRCVRRGHERYLRTSDDRRETGGQALQGPAAFALVLGDLDAPGQRRKPLPRRAHDDDRPAGRARDDARHAAQQRGPVPFQRRLRRAHPRRASPGENDPGSCQHTCDGTAPAARCCGADVTAGQPGP
jgi:hypothetical protein